MPGSTVKLYKGTRDYYAPSNTILACVLKLKNSKTFLSLSEKQNCYLQFGYLMQERKDEETVLANSTTNKPRRGSESEKSTSM